MAEGGRATDDVEDNILYDLTIPAEWPQEPETINRVVKEKSQVSLTGRLSAAAYRSLWTFLRSIGFPMRTASPCSLPSELVKLVSSHINWHLVLTRDGKHLAVLQDQVIEVRSSRDEFSAIVGRGIVPADPYPQWRTLGWSCNGDMLASTDSSGRVDIFDLVGTNILTIPSDEGQSTETVTTKPNSPVDLSNAVAGLIFKETKAENWSTDLIVINYHGSLKCYNISDEGKYQVAHSFEFSLHYPRGISAVTYIAKHSILLIGGAADPDPDTGEIIAPSAVQCGLTAWRMLSGSPHYKLVTDYEHDVGMSKRKYRLVRRLRNLTSFPYNWRRIKKDGIYAMSLSPSRKMLATVHYSGRFSLWHVPSLRLASTWALEQQPGYDDLNPEVAENPKRRKQMKDFLKAYNIVDANWWSEQAVILARGTGALYVSSGTTLRNLLGTSPEWFEPGPIVTPALDGGFLGLECEMKFSSLKRRVVEDEHEEYEDSDDELDATLVTKTTKYVKWVLHYVTDIESFQPPRKRPKIVTKTYRLVNLKSTTPEELYQRKIEHEEYGEALALAKAYGLDCDLVYQRQWRKTPVSVASIQDYLSKISKRCWVLNDCLERVPDNIDAMRELLRYGLRGTDLEALIAIGKREDGGRFILCDTGEAYDESIDMYDKDAHEDAKLQEREARLELVATVDFESLTLEQRELCRARTRLLQYLDRLSTYEEILGGIQAAEERFDPKFFEKFRSQNIVELAVDYARQCDWRALEIVFEYHGAKTLPHRLAILSNFPETFAPFEYRSLLPEAGSRSDDPEVLEWVQGAWQEEDWCEMTACRNAIDPNPFDLGAFLYDENPDYRQFRGLELTRAQLTDWYGYRAREIEKLSCQVDHALDFVRLAMERYVQGLEHIHDNMVTMETLVYECFMDESLTFEDFEKMEDIDKLRLLMSRSSDEMFVKNLRRWLVPFLQRCEKQKPGCFNELICEYLVTMAKDDLSRCLKVFESSKANLPDPVISDNNKVISMALQCIHACESNDQLSNAFGILECLPDPGFGVASATSKKLHRQVDELECHLFAAETLENNGLPQTIAFIRDTQNDKEETKKLFTKMTRVAGRKSPPLTEAQWRKLLTDVLTLREKTYRCVEPNICYEIFVESMLCSSRPENIRLAGEMMERSAAEASEPDYPAGDRDDAPLLYKVAYPKALMLVLSSAQEYFNSSASLTDSCMELARQCLHLINDQPQSVNEELDLIESLAMLDGFGVSMLPLQVRMCSDRLELIQKAIQAKPFTYKNSERLLRLARLLRISGNNQSERDGSVLKLVAQAALKAKDQRVAHDTCLRLMKAGYAPVWEECKTLAQLEEFQDIQAKAELLSFSVTHCAPEMIEPILKAKCLLDTQLFYERLRKGDRDITSPSRETSPFSTRGAIKQTKEILTSTTNTTKTVLSAVSDRKWWQKTLKNLHPLRQATYTEDWDDRNVKLEKQGCSPFYASIIENCYSNTSEADFKNLCLKPDTVNGLQFSEGVLRMGKLEETLTEGATTHPADEVLLQLAQDVISQDAALGLAYLMALSKPVDAEACFSKLPRTAISLQLATYFYSLQIYSRLSPPARPQPASGLYQHNPSNVIQNVINHVTQTDQSHWPEGVEELVERLKYYHELMTDFNQAQVLQGLGKGVDVARFTSDNDYKHETILGLAMTLEQPVYEIAVSLAKRYNLPLWNVYMTHLEFLFDSGISTSEVEDRVTKQGLLYAVSKQPEEFVTRMTQYVYPILDGCDHGRLMYYYSLLEGCLPQSSSDKTTISPETHVKLLKKIKPAAKGLDYKKLLDGKQRPLDVIRPVLNSGNVHVLAKLAPKIPDQHGGFLQSSLVFCAWALKRFWESEKPGSGPPKTKANWVHRYESCGEYLQRLVPDDVRQFIDDITFVPQALDELDVECRQEIVRRAIKFCKQNISKKKKPQDGAKSELSWEDVVTHMQQSQFHLEKLHDPTIINLQEAEDGQLQQYARLFDLSRSEPEKVHELCVRMVLDGHDLSVVSDILDVLPGDAWTPRTAVTEAISLTVAAFSYHGEEEVDSLLEGRDLLKTLQAVVQVVSDHENNGGDSVNTDDVMTLLRPFCADMSVAVQPRLDVLQMLEQTFKLSDEDLVLLIRYRTDAIVSTGWKDKKVTEAQVATDAGRQELFESLLAGSHCLDQFLALAQLLNVWPPLVSFQMTDVSNRPWCQLMVSMVATCGEAAAPSVVSIVKDLKGTNHLSQQCVKYIFDKLLEDNLSVAAVKCVLMCNHDNLYNEAVEELAKHNQGTDDDELCHLVLQNHLVAHLVNTPYYSILVKYVISKQTPGEEMLYFLNVETIANQLQEQGYDAEAGSLMLQYRGTHPAMRTFDMALGVLSRWFSR